MSAHSYWRLRITASNGASYISIADMALHTIVGGSQAATSMNCTLTATNEAGANYLIGGILDGIVTPEEGHVWVTGPNPTFPVDVVFHFASPISIAEFSITSQPTVDEGYGSGATRAPRDFSFAHSDDGSTYTTDLTVAGASFGPAGTSVTNTYLAQQPFTEVDATDTRTGQSIVILVPSSASAVPYNSANPTNVVLVIHGQDGTQATLATDPLLTGCVSALANAGYILAMSNAHGNGWGNQASVDDIAALDEYVRNNYNVKNMCLWSASMGGIVGLNAISQGKLKRLVGWLGTFPACNLANNVTSSGLTAAINTAFGITGSGIYTYAHQTYGHDPMLKNAYAFYNLPMRFYASAGDTVVNKAANSDAFANLVASTSREHVVVSCTGDHGDPSHFQPSDYLAFFRRCFATPVSSGDLVGALLPTGVVGGAPIARTIQFIG